MLQIWIKILNYIYTLKHILITTVIFLAHSSISLSLLFSFFLCMYVCCNIFFNYTCIYHRRPALMASWLSGSLSEVILIWLFSVSLVLYFCWIKVVVGGLMNNLDLYSNNLDLYSVRGGCYFAYLDFFLLFHSSKYGGYNTNKGSKRIFGIRPPEPPCTCPLKVATSHFRHKTWILSSNFDRQPKICVLRPVL